ncbi:MAG: EAL domain-containing protein [Pseudomonadota bacterium]
MQRLSELSAFPIVAGTLGVIVAMAASAVFAIGPSAALGVGVFAAAMALRNWSVAETDRPLLAEELGGIHDRLDTLQDDAEELRELLTDLAAIVEEAAAREQAAMRALGRRLSAVEGAAAPATELEMRAMERAREALEPLEDRLDQFDARTRKLALALEKRLGAAERPTPARSDAPETTLEDLSGQQALGPDPSADEPSTEEAQPRAAESADRALDRQYALMLQPIFSASDGEPRFFEAYTRRVLEHGGVAPAADHIAEARAAGQVAPIDKLQLARCVASAEQLRTGGRDVAVFCNISMVSLRDPDDLRVFLNFLRKNARLARHLVFEFNQLELEEFCDADIAILQRLRETGFVFSIDHLENWSIDISNLAKIGFRYVKIDAGALLAREDKSPGATDRLVRSFSRAGLSMIVEKVESGREAQRLEAAGAQLLQGAGLAEPRLIQVEDPAFSKLERAARAAVFSGQALDAPASPASQETGASAGKSGADDDGEGGGPGGAGPRAAGAADALDAASGETDGVEHGDASIPRGRSSADDEASDDEELAPPPPPSARAPGAATPSLGAYASAAMAAPQQRAD